MKSIYQDGLHHPGLLHRVLRPSSMWWELSPPPNTGFQYERQSVTSTVSRCSLFSCQGACRTTRVRAFTVSPVPTRCQTPSKPAERSFAWRVINSDQCKQGTSPAPCRQEPLRLLTTSGLVAGMLPGAERHKPYYSTSISGAQSTRKNNILCVLPRPRRRVPCPASLASRAHHREQNHVAQGS